MNAIARLQFPVTRSTVAALVVALLSMGQATVAWAQGVCNPQCGPNQVCVQGTCMVPAPPPPAAYPPPPSSYQQTAPPPAQYVPPQGNGYPPPPAAANVYAPPAQGYPPANNYGAPPAQGYPPAGNNYPPQQVGYPPAPPPQGLSQRRGFLALPFLGINSYQGSTGTNLGAGLRLGVLLGGHINEMFSANGELTIDVINIGDVSGVDNASAADVVLAFSPLFHLPFGIAEFAVGPKLGIRSGAGSSTVAGLETKNRLMGYVFGLNAGIFAAVSDSISIGGLLMAEVRSVHQYCATAPGSSESCSTDPRFTGDADKVIGFAGAALF